MAPIKRKHSEMSVLITQRNNAKTNMQRIFDVVKEISTSVTKEELECRKEIVESYFQQALEFQARIEELDDETELINAPIVRGEIEDLYCNIKVKIKTLMNNFNNKCSSSCASTASKLPENLPRLSLPTFAGKYTDFPNFMRLFKTLVHNEPRISKIEKFNHLISCLSGPALRAIRSLDLIEENYEVAIKLLEDRFDNKQLICQEHINSLCQLTKIQKDSPVQLRQLVDGVSAHLNSLSSLLSYEEICNALIVNLVVTSLDKESQTKLEEASDYSKAVSWTNCAQILTKRCQLLETRESHTSHNVISRSAKSLNKNALSAARVHFCNCCKQNNDHGLWKCPDFEKLTPMQRFEFIKKLALCINCFSSQHTVRQCKSSSCKKCGGSHHTMLHRTNDSSTIGNQPHSLQTQSPSSQHHQQMQQQCLAVQLSPKHAQWCMAPSFTPSGDTSTSTVITDQQSLIGSQHSGGQAILATAMVMVINNGQKHLARALLDSASQLNFVTQSFANKLHLDKKKISTVIGGIGESQTQAKFSTTARIQSCNNNFTTDLHCYVLPSITGLQPYANINISNWNLPEKDDLADPNFNIAQKVDLLIGVDVFYELLKGNRREIGPDCPILMDTVFGWIVAGKCNVQQRPSAFVAEQITEPSDLPLEELVKQFWELEKIPEAQHKWTKEQTECESHFQQNVQRLPSGRYVVRLPFKQSPKVLGDSKSMAIRRFHNLERKFAGNNELKKAYSKFLQQYISDGHMEEIPWPQSLTGYYIMPHQCVWRPDKSTTKCRVVFDASARSSSNLSLNDILKVGPVVQNDLVDILMRFRLHKYALMADVEAMYRQIMVNDEDCKVQNIVWRSEASEPLKLYKLNTVTYGTASAPYLATRCLVELANENEQKFPTACKIIKTDFYVDDLITGGSSLAEIKTIKQEVSLILQQAGFNLRKWFSNHQQFLHEIPEDQCEYTIQNVIKTLGVIWDAESDSFKFSYTANSCNGQIVTKRRVLSELSKLFDPLGLINPIILKLKIFLQELWLQKLNWDDAISEEHAIAWKNFTQELVNLSSIKVSRYMILEKAKIELHGFADASTRAYGGCIYIRCVDTSGNIKVTLMTSRSKVAPISTVRSLPCLELCGAHLLTQLLQKVRNIHTFTNVYLWTDSVIVLHWLAEHASNLNTFVANRVAFIQENTEGAQWRYVPSSPNPADLVSRGAKVQELNSSIWFSGPTFLQERPDSWPQQPKGSKPADLPERKTVKTVLHVSTNELLNIVYAISDFAKTCRIVAYTLRFVNNCQFKTHREQSTSKIITAKERDKAFIKIVYWLQQSAFASEIEALSNNKQVPNKSLLKNLNPFLDHENECILLKVGGRLKKAKLPYAAKCPIIMPKNNAFVQSYIRHVHVTNFHAGAQALVCIIQERFWIIGARQYARKIVKNCVLCFKYRPQMMAQVMGDLPAHRVSPVKPFTHCGVDFCGPIMTTSRIRGKPRYKSYVAVFICFVTRAVHLEVVSDLSAEAFIAALKRFVGRRGLCTTLYCDNATNFVGARNILKEYKLAFLNEQYQNQVAHWCASQTIEFKHIPPRSPHFGGLWEAAVKSAKSLLYKIMLSAVLTFEELTTVMAQIEGILNSRPIMVMSTDPSDERALTPAHFLNQSKAECIAEPATSFKNISVLKHWQKISALQQHFWNRWSREYLTLLQQRNKWTQSNPNIKVGALVMVHEDHTPPQKWVIGRIIQVIPGTDGKVRVADVRTSSGVIRRSMTKLAALPINDLVETS